MVGLGGFEPPTSPLSGVRSNQLSYRPNILSRALALRFPECIYADTTPGLLAAFVLKEVIQPHLPVRLPCYDFTPVMDHTVVTAFPEGFGWPLLVQPTPMV